MPNKPDQPKPDFQVVVDPNAPKGDLRPLVELLLRKAEEELRARKEREADGKA